MIYPASVVLSVLETCAYGGAIALTHFPCSVSIREDLANSLIDIGFLYIEVDVYRITEAGDRFLNNSTHPSKI